MRTHLVFLNAWVLIGFFAFFAQASQGARSDFPRNAEEARQLYLAQKSGPIGTKQALALARTLGEGFGLAVSELPPLLPPPVYSDQSTVVESIYRIPPVSGTQEGFLLADTENPDSRFLAFNNAMREYQEIFVKMHENRQMRMWVRGLIVPTGMGIYWILPFFATRYVLGHAISPAFGSLMGLVALVISHNKYLSKNAKPLVTFPKIAWKINDYLERKSLPRMRQQARLAFIEGFEHGSGKRIPEPSRKALLSEEFEPGRADLCALWLE